MAAAHLAFLRLFSAHVKPRSSLGIENVPPLGIVENDAPLGIREVARAAACRIRLVRFMAV